MTYGPITTPCRFARCPDTAIAHVELANGCLCYPNETEMFLCWQHLERMNPLGKVLPRVTILRDWL